MIVILPLILIVLATVASGIVAYGTHPVWMAFEGGLSFILFSRRFEWPLVMAALLLSMGLIFLVASGKRRAWWLIGLSPVLGLFAHRFGSADSRPFTILDSPQFVSADQALYLKPQDYVVGVVFGQTAYAYPYADLFSTPVVIEPNRNRRMVLMWSPFANHACAWTIDHGIRSRELDVVSMPANALLLYNARYGQFINGLTGKTMDGKTPTGFIKPLDVWKMPWKDWRRLHPDTQVLDRTLWDAPPVLSGPLKPKYPIPAPPHWKKTDAARVAIIETTPPMIVRQRNLRAAVWNVFDGHNAVLLFQNASSGTLRAFDREGDEQLFLHFRRNADTRRPNVALIDAQTHTGWSADGVAVDGPGHKNGAKLRPIQVESDLPWKVMKYWHPTWHIEELLSPG